MPKFANTSPDMESHSAGGGSFQFSAVKLSSLGATEYTLVCLAVDRSGSTFGFSSESEAAVKAIVESCRLSPRADNLLLRVVRFNHEAEEIHGFKPLADVNVNDYNGKFDATGGTALYDTTTDLAAALGTYAKTLADADYSTNAILVVVTDGYNEGGRLGVQSAKKAIEDATRSEVLESLVTILIGLNVQNSMISSKLAEFKQDAGFGQYVEAKDATPKTLAKVAQFISKSISAQSQALGTGGPSQPITF